MRIKTVPKHPRGRKALPLAMAALATPPGRSAPPPPEVGTAKALRAGALSIARLRSRLGTVPAAGPQGADLVLLIDPLAVGVAKKFVTALEDEPDIEKKSGVPRARHLLHVEQQEGLGEIYQSCAATDGAIDKNTRLALKAGWQQIDDAAQAINFLLGERSPLSPAEKSDLREDTREFLGDYEKAKAALQAQKQKNAAADARAAAEVESIQQESDLMRTMLALEQREPVDMTAIEQAAATLDRLGTATPKPKPTPKPAKAAKPAKASKPTAHRKSR